MREIDTAIQLKAVRQELAVISGVLTSRPHKTFEPDLGIFMEPAESFGPSFEPGVEMNAGVTYGMADLETSLEMQGMDMDFGGMELSSAETAGEADGAEMGEAA